VFVSHHSTTTTRSWPPASHAGPRASEWPPTRGIVGTPSGLLRTPSLVDSSGAPRRAHPGGANRHELEYVVIGAFAAIAQGVPQPATYDVDVTPRRGLQNLECLSVALTERDARMRDSDPSEGLAFTQHHLVRAGRDAETDMLRCLWLLDAQRGMTSEHLEVGVCMQYGDVGPDCSCGNETID
jgi:hypothetical protein